VQAGKAASGAKFVAEEMIVVHNCFLRHINAVYRQGENVDKNGSEQDIQDYMNYALQWHNILHEHHTGEEKYIFPGIEELAGETGAMNRNVQQHHEFEPGLNAYQKYINEVLKGKEKYSWAKFKEIIDSFMPVVREHLSEEIDTLIGLEKYDRDWEGWFKEVQAGFMKRATDNKIKVDRPWVKPRIEKAMLTASISGNGPADDSHEPRQDV
jgi:hemerythrin superfamily protein